MGARKLSLILLIAAAIPVSKAAEPSAGSAKRLPRCDCYGPRGVYVDGKEPGCWPGRDGANEVYYHQGCTVNVGAGAEGGECEAWTFTAQNGKVFSINGMLGEITVQDPKNCEFFLDRAPAALKNWKKR